MKTMTSRIKPGKRRMKVDRQMPFFMRGTRWALVQWWEARPWGDDDIKAMRTTLTPDHAFIMIMALPQIPPSALAVNMPLLTIDAEAVAPIVNALLGVGDRVKPWSLAAQSDRLYEWLPADRTPLSSIYQPAGRPQHPKLPDMHLTVVAHLSGLLDWCMEVEDRYWRTSTC